MEIPLSETLSHPRSAHYDGALLATVKKLRDAKFDCVREADGVYRKCSGANWYFPPHDPDGGGRSTVVKCEILDQLKVPEETIGCPYWSSDELPDGR